jgi:hypothetical protein
MPRAKQFVTCHCVTNQPTPMLSCIPPAVYTIAPYCPLLPIRSPYIVKSLDNPHLHFEGHAGRVITA